MALLMCATAVVKAQKVIDYPPKLVIICMDGDTRRPMGGVKVVFKKGDTLIKTLTTDGTGRCLILKPRGGEYSISANKQTYFTFTLKSVDVRDDQTTILEIPLDAQPDKKKGGKEVALRAYLAEGSSD